MNRRFFLLGGATVPFVRVPTPETIPHTQKGNVIGIDPSEAGRDVSVSYTFGPGVLYVGGREVARVTGVTVTREATP